MYPTDPYPPNPPFPSREGKIVDLYRITAFIENQEVGEVTCIVTFDTNRGSEEIARRIVKNRLSVNVTQVGSSTFLGTYQTGSQSYHQQTRQADFLFKNHTETNFGDFPIYWY